MLLIGASGERIGVIPMRQALLTAREAGLDLVEVAPNASPPVCRLIDYGKFKFEQIKKEREAKKHQKSNVLREIRFRPKIHEHDLEAKANMAQRLLEDGNKVRITVVFRGREGSHPEIGWKQLRRLAELVKDHALIEKPPATEGENLVMIIAPGKEMKEGKEKKRSVDAQDEKPQGSAAPLSPHGRGQADAHQTGEKPFQAAQVPPS